jgi:hypothetical protein
MNDYCILAAYAVILGFSKSKDSLLLLICFGASVLYMNENSHPAWIDHLIISLAFLPAVVLTTKWVAISSLCYTIFQWATSGEYILSETSEYLIGNFSELAIGINLLIMVSLIYERYNYNYHTDSMLGDSWVINLCIRHFQIFSKKKGEGQC